MSPASQLLLLVASLVGHGALLVWCYNRLHALDWRRSRVKLVERILLLASCLLAAIHLAFAYSRGLWLDLGLLAHTNPTLDEYLLTLYPLTGLVALLIAIPKWLLPKLIAQRPPILVAHETRHIDLRKELQPLPLGTPRGRFAAAIPFTEILQLQIERKTLRVPHLPAALSGLTIAHLSDLHLIGDLTEAFFSRIVDETLALDADMIAITGDILEVEACYDWLPGTLGRLRAREGVYYVLGNHDKRLADPGDLRRRLDTLGFTPVAARTLQRELRGTKISITGNELPWFGPAPEIADHQPIAASTGERPFRLLLTHTPDLYPWAREHGFDLMLAGHNHGGQIRLPGLGALITPSLFGSRYAGGLYDEKPTVLHVSRGISGQHPLRWNCPPELALLTLLPRP